MDDFEGVKEDFELNTEMNREPMKLLQDRGDVGERRVFWR